jgi:hypothetical protein
MKKLKSILCFTLGVCLITSPLLAHSTLVRTSPISSNLIHSTHRKSQWKNLFFLEISIY